MWIKKRRGSIPWSPVIISSQITPGLGAAENFRPGYNKPSYPSSLPPPSPSTLSSPLFIYPFHYPIPRLYLFPTVPQLLDRLEPFIYFGHHQRVRRARATLGNAYYSLSSPSPLLAGRVTESYNAPPSCSRSRYRLI